MINKSVTASVLMAASLLAACGSTPPANPPSSRTAANVQPDAMDSGQAAAALGMPGYRLKMTKGVEYYCRREAVTGSRLEVHEICLTREQLERQRDLSQEALRQIQRPPQETDVPSTQPGAGGY